MSLLVVSKILALFLNAMSADHKYSLCNRKSLQQSIQMQLYKKQNFFLNFLLYFWNPDAILNILKKKTWPSALIYFRH